MSHSTFLCRYVLKSPKPEFSKRKPGGNPLLLLDYRCYVAGGAIGTAYPRPLKQCLARLASMHQDQAR